MPLAKTPNPPFQPYPKTSVRRRRRPLGVKSIHHVLTFPLQTTTPLGDKIYNEQTELGTV